MGSASMRLAPYSPPTRIQREGIMGERTHQRGVTLIEGAVVMAIGAITVTTAAPGFQSFVEKQRLDGAAAQLATDIQLARAEAMLRNTGVRLSLQSKPWGSCYVIH